MPAVINVPYGGDQAVKLYSMALFVANAQRNTTLNRLTGKMPQQADAENHLRNQSSTNYPIVVCKDLQKGPGDEVTFDLVNHINGKPIMGDETAEGTGESLNFSQDKLRINQTRKAINAGGVMSQQRTRWQLRSLCRTLGEAYMNALTDQIQLVHLAGSRGFHNNIEWKVPLASDADFTKIMINTVRAPTKNRHFMSTGSGVEGIAASGSEISIATTDVMNTEVVDAIRTLVDSMPLPPQPVIFDGDVMATDAPLRVLLVSSEQYTAFVQSPGTNFRQLQAQAVQRSGMGGKQNPLFLGEAGLWNGILIVKMPKPIRFYAGNSIAWCASNTSLTETTTDLVPAAFGTSYAVDRALLLGGQALASALGKNVKSGNPFFWNEEEMDHGNTLEVLVGMINGCSKIRFKVDFGDAGEQYTDNGIIAIDTAVKIAGVA
jgi:N4-gp56 family major capsid protein